MRDLGDCEQLKITHRSNSTTWKQHRRPGGGNLARQDNLEGVDLAIQMQEWYEENLAMVTQGSLVKLDEETVSGEEVMLIPGSLARTEFPGAKSLVITKKTDSSPIPLSEVEVSAAGIRVKKGSAVITTPTPALLAYTSTAATRLEALIEPGAEYEIVFDGLNEADSGRPVVVTLWRWKAPPAEELALIDDQNPGKLLSKGEALADVSRPVGESPFYRADLL
ncbi:hypothetical protein DMX10_31995 [Pseudomonas sp. 57B-090624]|nr:hypothetical protein DMX10_31995 [Pseudomonas sp. 57B-090624]